MSKISDFDYKAAYKDMNEIFETPAVRKALIFAAENPEQVYGKDSEEYNAVVHGGYFSLYSSIADSNSLSERT